MADDDLEALRALPSRDVSPSQASALLRRAGAAQAGRFDAASFSRLLVPAGLACTAVLYLQWALQVTGHR